jgi:hypothetical protein
MISSFGYLAYSPSPTYNPTTAKGSEQIPTKVYLCLRLTKFDCCWSNCSTSGRDKGAVVTTPIISSEFQKRRMRGGDMLACAAAAAGSPSRRKKVCTF